MAGELAHAIRRVADAVVAHVAATDARARASMRATSTFRRMALGDGASASRDDAPDGSPGRPRRLECRNRRTGRVSARNALSPAPSPCYRPLLKGFVAAVGRENPFEVDRIPMNMTSMPPFPDPTPSAPPTTQMEQIRELLVGDILRRTTARAECSKRGSRSSRARSTRRFEALLVRIEALAGETHPDRRSAFDELSRGVAELGERIRHLSQRLALQARRCRESGRWHTTFPAEGAAVREREPHALRSQPPHGRRLRARRDRRSASPQASPRFSTMRCARPRSITTRRSRRRSPR